MAESYLADNLTYKQTDDTFNYKGRHYVKSSFIEDMAYDYERIMNVKELEKVIEVETRAENNKNDAEINAVIRANKKNIRRDWRGEDNMAFWQIEENREKEAKAALRRSEKERINKLVRENRSAIRQIEIEAYKLALARKKAKNEPGGEYIYKND